MDENKTAQTKDMTDGISVHGDAGVDANNSGIAVAEDNITDFSDTSEEKKGASSGGESNAEKVRNAEAAERRRESKRQRELRAERVNSTIEALGGINPYTKEKMTDEVDVAEYEMMRETEKRGGDPVEDVRRQMKEKQREELNEERKKAEDADYFEKDARAFKAAHPDVDLEKLVRNEKFAIFAEGKVKRMPLSKIYEDYLRFNGAAETEKKTASAKQMAAQIVANRKASPGSLSDSAETSGKFFTAAQVRAMSQAEVSRNYDAIRESMKKW